MTSTALVHVHSLQAIIGLPIFNDSLRVDENGELTIKDRVRAVMARANLPIVNPAYRVLDTAISLYDGRQQEEMGRELSSSRREITRLTAELDVLKLKEEMANDQEEHRIKQKDDAVASIAFGIILAPLIVTLPLSAGFVGGGIKDLIASIYSQPDLTKAIQDKLKFYQLIEPTIGLREAYAHAKEVPGLNYSKAEYDSYAIEYRREHPHASFKQIDKALHEKKHAEFLEALEAQDRDVGPTPDSPEI